MARLFRILFLTLCVLTTPPSKAGIPVIDNANLQNSMQQVIAWGSQYAQMAQQYQQLVQQYNQAVSTFNSLNGVRGMADLVNTPALRRYLPNEWSEAMNLLQSPGGYTNLQGSINALRAANRIAGIEDTTLNPNSAAGRAMVGAQNQTALNRALGEEGYKQASERIAAIQTLIDKVNGAPEQKDVLDLQARIQSEQAMVQNESVKLALMAQLQQAQRDIQAQQAREVSIKALRGSPPPRF
ncbi:MAG: P-type DNA transfer protein VirB5 [Burkholderiales bacterium]|nr:P-type DNA transfer protein VirB5 [Burkholderiales bacterium]